MSKTTNVAVTVRSDERIEKALRRFRRACERRGIKGEVRRKKHYEKPSDARRRQERKLERNRRRAARKAEQREERRWKRIKRREKVLGKIQVEPRSNQA